MGNAHPCGGGRAGHSDQVWAHGSQRDPEPVPDPRRRRAPEAEVLRAEGRDAEIRYQDAIVPQMSSSEVVQLEPSETDQGHPTISPMPRLGPLTVPVWLDPKRYGDLDKYTNLDISQAWHRGVYFESRNFGYSTAVLNNDQNKVNEWHRELPNIIDHVNQLMLEHVPGFKVPDIPPPPYPPYPSPSHQF